MEAPRISLHPFYTIFSKMQEVFPDLTYNFLYSVLCFV